MRTTIAIFAAGAALLAAPSFAQLNPDGVANVNLVGQVGVKPGAAVSGLTQPVGDTVDAVDGAVNNSVDATKLTLATREQIRAGAQLHDAKGNSIGTVQSIDGDTAVVVREGTLYNVPIAQIYHGAVGQTHGLVTTLPSAEIKARTTAEVEAR